jgi:hypothetical protein
VAAEGRRPAGSKQQLQPRPKLAPKLTQDQIDPSAAVCDKYNVVAEQQVSCTGGWLHLQKSIIFRTLSRASQGKAICLARDKINAHAPANWDR